MVKPSLDINLAAPDIQAFKAKMNEASDHVGTISRHIAQHMSSASKAIENWGPVALKAGQVAASGMLLLSQGAVLALANWKKLAVIVGTFKLISDAVASARDQLKDMVAIADKAQNRGVAPAFFQAWNAEAKKLQLTTDDLGAALDHAFQATKEKSPIDVGKWETAGERITDIEKALRVLNTTVADGKLSGLILFRDAKTQDEKIQAVLKAMIQLEQAGHKLESLDLGERMFGSAFVDKIRQGRTSAESMLTTIQSAKGDADGIFPDALVRRAKEMDDQLKVAHQRLSTALKPSWDDLAGVLLTIKGYWADTVGLIAKAAELSNQIKIPGFASDTDIDAKRDALAKVNARLNGTSSWTDTFGVLASRETLEGHRDRLQSEIAALAKGDQYGPMLPSQSRGTGAKPTLKKSDTGSSTDKFDTSADSIDKRTAALQAEARTIDLGTAARDRARIVAQLETVAKQANAAAGKGANVILEEQRKRINEVADAYSAATLAIEKATIASSIKFGKQTALLDPQDVQIASQLKGLYPDVATALGSVEASAMRTNAALSGVASTASGTMVSGLTDMLDGTKSVGQGFADMSKVIIRALEEAIVKMLIVAPLMRGLQGMLGFSGGGAVSLPLPGAGDFIGPVAKADGGIIRGPGTATSDSINARLSDGEFVVRASQTAKHRALLETINAGNLPRFADGGMFGTGSSEPMIGGAGSGAVTQTNHIAVNITGNAGTPAQNADLAKQVHQQVTVAAQQMVARELRTQMRPGGILRDGPLRGR